MNINFDQLNQINKILKQYPNANLQIVTKNRDAQTIKDLINSGFRLFGENKVQEAKAKFKNIFNTNLELHLIGPLQTNKVKIALKLFDVIQSVDRLNLVKEIVKCREKTDQFRTKNFYIQINIGKEMQKSGVAPEDLEDLFNFCNQNNLPIDGLMCIPPADKDPEIYFNKMNELRDSLNPNLILSMGMSNDYRIALKCGSNLIRVGSKIFN